MAADLPETDGNDESADPSPLEIQMRAAEVRAGWTERERRRRLAYRTKPVELELIKVASVFDPRERRRR